MAILFLLSVLFIIYTYAVFPIVLHLMAKNKSPLVAETPDEWPSVSIVIAAHNEAEGLPGKIESLEALDYPPELVEWIVVSDGSTDNTHSLLQSAFEELHSQYIV